VHDTHLEVLIRQLRKGSSRRDVLRGLAGVGLGSRATRLPTVEAKRKKRHRHSQRQPKPNALGCLDEGARCKQTAAHTCCSGVCEPDTGKCGPLPPDAFGCTNSARTNFCSPDAAATNCPGHGGICIVDDDDRPLCVANTSCMVCATDADCEADIGPTWRCLRSCARCDARSGGSICVLPAI
jgi:hypothetical protein